MRPTARVAQDRQGPRPPSPSAESFVRLRQWLGGLRRWRHIEGSQHTTQAGSGSSVPGYQALGSGGRKAAEGQGMVEPPHAQRRIYGSFG